MTITNERTSLIYQNGHSIAQPNQTNEQTIKIVKIIDYKIQ